MKFAWQILTHTPIWVFPLFAYLVWLGIKAMRPRTVTIWRSLIVPAVFIVWGMSRLLSRADFAGPLAAWLGAAAVLLAVGFLSARPIELDHTTGEIKRPGSVVPLIRNVTVFALQYTVAVIAAVDPHDAQRQRSSAARFPAARRAISSDERSRCCGNISGNATQISRPDRPAGAGRCSLGATVYLKMCNRFHTPGLYSGA